MKTLTLQDVHNRGLTYRRLDWWVRAGYLHPHQQGGTGNTRTWPPSQHAHTTTDGHS
jgi:Fe2+ or Zn2+ uptake regulation protein